MKMDACAELTALQQRVRENTRFPVKLLEILHFVSKHTGYDKIIGAMWLTDSIFLTNSRILAKFLHLKPNTINYNLRTHNLTKRELSPIQKKQFRDWKAHSHPEITRNQCTSAQIVHLSYSGPPCRSRLDDQTGSQMENSIESTRHTIPIPIYDAFTFSNKFEQSPISEPGEQFGLLDEDFQFGLETYMLERESSKHNIYTPENFDFLIPIPEPPSIFDMLYLDTDVTQPLTDQRILSKSRYEMMF